MLQILQELIDTLLPMPAGGRPWRGPSELPTRAATSTAAVIASSYAALRIARQAIKGDDLVAPRRPVERNGVQSAGTASLHPFRALDRHALGISSPVYSASVYGVFLGL